MFGEMDAAWDTKRLVARCRSKSGEMGFPISKSVWLFRLQRQLKKGESEK